MPRKTPTGGITIGVIGFSPIVPNNSFSGAIGIPYTVKNPQQIVGLNPLYPCVDECRVTLDQADNAQKNLIFGNIISGVPEANPSYENDFTTFLIDLSIYTANPSASTVTIRLQKLIANVWTNVATLNNNNLGIFYGVNTIVGHKTYAGYAVNWGKVLFAHLYGTYRVTFSTTFKGSSGCLVSDCFYLRQFDCDLAHGTVKFENWITGKIGDPYKDYYLHDLCGISWYDSVRLRGFFGYPKASEYKEEMLEWGNPKHGYQERVRDEEIRSYEWKSNYLLEGYQTRFSTFGMMADELRVSDYNINNSDYSIKRMLIVKDGGFEPTYIDIHWHRKSKVSVKFKRGVQSIIKSICCDTRPVGSG